MRGLWYWPSAGRVPVGASKMIPLSFFHNDNEWRQQRLRDRRNNRLSGACGSFSGQPSPHTLTTPVASGHIDRLPLGRDAVAPGARWIVAGSRLNGTKGGAVLGRIHNQSRRVDVGNGFGSANQPRLTHSGPLIANWNTSFRSIHTPLFEYEYVFYNETR